VAAALGGLTLGWWVYRGVAAGSPDPLERALGPVHRILKNKYYFDELYEDVFVRPAYWLSETVVARCTDRGLIDGTLHAIGGLSLRVGAFLRKWFDLLVINWIGDQVGNLVKLGGSVLRFVQTGRVQQYLVVGLVFVGLVFTGLLLLRP